LAPPRKRPDKSSPALAPAPPPLHGGLNGDSGQRHGTVGAALLLGVLFVVVLGVFGAIYFDEFPGISYGTGHHAETAAPAVPLVQSTPIAPAVSAPANPNFAAAPVPPAVPPAPPMTPPQPGPPPQVQAAPVIAPPQAAQSLATITPAAGRETPPGLAARPGYWVEYGAYRGSAYAERLKKSLSDQGISAKVTRATGDDGVYYRVRSAATADRDVAAAAAARAQSALNIAPLLHREGEAAEAAYTPAPSPSTAAPLKYWVQFGAYDSEYYAKKLVETLRRDGIASELVKRLGPERRPIYFVRSPLLPDRDQARQLAERGETALGSATLLGQTLPATAPTRRL
jgi:cell division protein FtsN